MSTTAIAEPLAQAIGSERFGVASEFRSADLRSSTTTGLPRWGHWVTQNAYERSSCGGRKYRLSAAVVVSAGILALGAFLGLLQGVAT